MIGRVNGVDFTSTYGSTKIMGWRKIEKPGNFTWKEYMYFLLDTLPEETKQNYLAKLETSKKFWSERGGAIDDNTIKELKDEGDDIEVVGRVSKQSDKNVIRVKDYLDDTNAKDFSAIPTYKRMCICIMKNDVTCKYMGFSQTKAEVAKRKNAIKKYQNIL